MRKTVLFVLCGFFVGLVSGPVFSGAYMGHGGGRWQGGGLRLLSPWMLQKLNLSTDPQIQKIQATFKDKYQQSYTQLKAAHEDITTTFYASGAPDKGKLEASLKNVSDIQSQLMQDHLDEALEVRALLKPEQLATAAQFIERLHQMHAQMQDLSTEH